MDYCRRIFYNNWCYYTIILFMQDRIEKKIDNKVNDPIFIRKLADEVRLPFLIIDENNIILADFGAYQYINKIDVLKNEKNEFATGKVKGERRRRR